MKKNLLAIISIIILGLIPISFAFAQSASQIEAICRNPVTDEATYFQYDCDRVLSQTPANPTTPVNPCRPITSSNYPFCCPSVNDSVGKSCVDYKLATCKTNPNDPLCPTTGQIGGGTQNTNPTNSGANNSDSTIAPTPQASSAALKSCNAISFDSLLDILIWLKCIIGAAVIPLIFTIAFLVFIWGVLNYMRNADNEKKREESKKFIYYGIIGLTVMVAVWGIVRIVTTTFGLGNTVPQLQTECLTNDKNNPCK